MFGLTSAKIKQGGSTCLHTLNIYVILSENCDISKTLTTTVKIKSNSSEIFDYKVKVSVYI